MARSSSSVIPSFIQSRFGELVKVSSLCNICEARVLTEGSFRTLRNFNKASTTESVFRMRLSRCSSKNRFSLSYGVIFILNSSALNVLRAHSVKAFAKTDFSA